MKESKLLFILTACLGLFIGCQQGSSRQGAAKSEEAIAEKSKMDTIIQHPAFEGQTNIKPSSSTTRFILDTITTGVVRPWGLVFMPDNRILFTEKPGQIRIIDEAGNPGDTIRGVPPVHFQQDGGLLDLVLSPDFNQSREVFWAYSETRDTGYVPTVVRATLSGDETRFDDVTIIYRAGPAVGSVMHYGAKLLFDEEGYLLVSFGERQEPRIRGRAQDYDSAFGKIIRIDREGNAAEGNPFSSLKDTLGEIWAMGLRDPQGLAFHPVTGELWCSDHGPKGGDEINVIEKGANYGWPTIAYGTEYTGEQVGEGTIKEGMKQPVYYWTPSVAPAGITFCSGKLFPEWKNNLFVACLRGQRLVRLVVDGHKVVAEEALLLDWEQRIRGVEEAPDGSLYIWTDQGEGCIARLIPAETI